LDDNGKASGTERFKAGDVPRRTKISGVAHLSCCRTFNPQGIQKLSSRGHHPTNERQAQLFREQATWCRLSAARTPILEERQALLHEAEVLEEMAAEFLKD
jgi:hypothetical protein